VRVKVLPNAEADLTRQYRYYLVDRDAPEVATRFREEVVQSFQQIKRNPDLGSPVPAAGPGVRRWPIAGFDKFGVYYVAVGGELHVLRVLHGSRDPRRISAEIRRSLKHD
jgi:plasmid stabilization system protein ParE